MASYSDLSEKLRALQDRDKGLRESRERHTDITTARAVIGTCNDMCPEVERIWREETKQVSPLEMDAEGRPDHYAMVKEYRRAGADQSEPLAHELRPGSVLERTMDYLLCNIMDKPESNPEVIEEWYDFLWSRTRAIRKDITQQHFCDLSSVTLLEKCTRFHIHCAATLVEQDAAVFTPKINDENLSKCLQSLKDFYHDLSVKSNQKCPNEAEFRGYEILLKLCDDNVLREIKNLDPAIRDSDPVAFASEAYFAFDSRNHVRFFELVKSTTYLNACLLHRYFLPVRTSALKLIRRAYTATMKAVETYSLDLFREQLAFDSNEQAGSFLLSFGLQVEDGTIFLTRERSSDVVEPPPVCRSFTLVEGKRRGLTVGEVVNGGPLPANPYKKYPLYSSFDTSGTMKEVEQAKPSVPSQPQFTVTFNAPTMNPIFGNGSNQGQGFSFKNSFAQSKPVESIFKPSESLFKQPESIFKPSENIFKSSANLFKPIETAKSSSEQVTAVKPQVDVDKELNEIANREVERLMTECVQSEVKEMIRNAAQEEVKEHVAVSLSDQVLQDCLNLFQRQILNSVIGQAREEAAVARKRSLMLEATEQLADVIIQEFVDFEVGNICFDVRSKSIREYHDVESYKIFKYICDQVVETMAQDVVRECFSEAVQEQQSVIDGLVEKKRMKLARKYFNHWFTKYQKAKRYRMIRDTFPASNMSGVAKIVVSENRPTTRSSLRRKLNNSYESESTKKQAKTPNGKRKRESSGQVTHVSKVSALGELISVRDNPSPTARLRLLDLQLEEEKKSSQRMGEALDVLSRSFQVIEELKKPRV